MIQRMSLKARLMLAIVLLVTIISTLFVSVVWQIKVQLEAIAFSHMVADQLTLILQSPDGPAGFDDSQLRDWRLYYDDSLLDLPAAFATLPEGSHHRVRTGDGSYFQVEVRNQGSERVVLTQDITEWELQELWLLQFLAVGVLLVMGVAVLTGWRASSAVLAPLQALTSQLSHIRPDQRGVRLSKEWQGNEVGLIARAFDQYLERLDRFVEREKYFAAAASHELRTPLSVVMGAAEVLETHTTEQAPPAARAAISRINRACHDMLGFIEVGLLLSREDARPAQDVRETVLNDVIHQLGDDCAGQLAERRITLHLQLENVIVVDQSESIVRAVISNLLRNAIEHTHDGNIYLVLEGSVLEVRDTGEGIPADRLSQVFERSYSTKPDGTGMGLHLVQRLCERFQWSIELQSVVGQGTCVAVDFASTARLQ